MEISKGIMSSLVLLLSLCLTNTACQSRSLNQSSNDLFQRHPATVPAIAMAEAGTDDEDRLYTLYQVDCGKGKESSQAIAEAWVKTEIPVGTTRAKAIEVLKSHGLELGLHRPEKLYAYTFTKACKFDFGPDFRLVIIVKLDSNALVSTTRVAMSFPAAEF